MKDLTYVSSKTMAAELDITIRTVQEWCKAKKIPGAYKVGKLWRADRSAWETFKKRIKQAA